MKKLILGALIAGAAVFATPAAARDYPVVITYVAPAEPQMGEPTIAFGEVVNAREQGEHWLGAIRGGYGNPLKVLVTEQPVHEVVAQAMRDGLEARGMAAENGAHRLNLRVIRFDCNQFIPKDAHVIFVLTLVDAQTGAALFEQTYQEHKVGGGIGGGIFTPVEPLRALANETLQLAIDRALDDPAFRAAVASAPAAAPVEAAAVAPAAPAEPAPATP